MNADDIILGGSTYKKKRATGAFESEWKKVSRGIVSAEEVAAVRKRMEGI
jgi:hypothetical protein